MRKQLTYGPPPLNQVVLVETLLEWYPSHKDEKDNLLPNLVWEYLCLWWMIQNHPERRVVAPGPIMAVQKAHAADRRRYLNDCVSYFNRVIPSCDMAWRGRTDHLGMHDTMRVYNDMFGKDADGPWIDMAVIDIERKSKFQVV